MIGISNIASTIVSSSNFISEEATITINIKPSILYTNQASTNQYVYIIVELDGDYVLNLMNLRCECTFYLKSTIYFFS